VSEAEADSRTEISGATSLLPGFRSTAWPVLVISCDCGYVESALRAKEKVGRSESERSGAVPVCVAPVVEGGDDVELVRVPELKPKDVDVDVDDCHAGFSPVNVKGILGVIGAVAMSILCSNLMRQRTEGSWSIVARLPARCRCVADVFAGNVCSACLSENEV
jgi:hypothetical protein